MKNTHSYEPEIRYSPLEQYCRYSRNAPQAPDPKCKHRSLDDRFRVSVAYLMGYFEPRKMSRERNPPRYLSRPKFRRVRLQNHVHSLKPKCQSLASSALCVSLLATASSGLARNGVLPFEEFLAYEISHVPLVLRSSAYARLVTIEPKLVIRWGGKYLPRLRVTNKDQDLGRLHC